MSNRTPNLPLQASASGSNHARKEIKRPGF